MHRSSAVMCQLHHSETTVGVKQVVGQLCAWHYPRLNGWCCLHDDTSAEGPKQQMVSLCIVVSDQSHDYRLSLLDSSAVVCESHWWQVQRRWTHAQTESYQCSHST